MDGYSDSVMENRLGVQNPMGVYMIRPTSKRDVKRGASKVKARSGVTQIALSFHRFMTQNRTKTNVSNIPKGMTIVKVAATGPYLSLQVHTIAG